MKSDIQLYTSYVSPRNIDYFNEHNILPIFILRKIYNSTLIGDYTGTSLHFKYLSPSDLLYRDMRDGIIDFETYAKKYIIEIAQLNFQEDVVDKLDALCKLSGASSVVLLGYGENPEKCHRRILANVLNCSKLLEKEITEIEII